MTGWLADYQGRRVLVSGGGGSGIGAHAAHLLAALGAEVHVFDLVPPDQPVGYFQLVDLSDPGAMDAAVAAIGSPIDRLFNCVGVLSARASALELMTVNFLGVRHLSERVGASMPTGGAVVSIASLGARGWRGEIDTWLPLVRTEDFESGLSWCREFPDLIDGRYAATKQALVVWTHYAALSFGRRGIRINCTSPGPTHTPLLVRDSNPVRTANYPSPLGRLSTATEQAELLIFLNGSGAGYVTGTEVLADGGTTAGVLTGGIDW